MIKKESTSGPSLGSTKSITSKKKKQKTRKEVSKTKKMS
jgi:hypothetical protein